jgi:hypothetical protein
MVQGLSPAALSMLKRKVSIEIDAETHRLMSELARQAGGDIPSVLAMLADKYNHCNFIEKQFVIQYLKGV